MRYSDYDKCISSINDLKKYKKLFENDIADRQKELEEFINRANKRIAWVNECEVKGDYIILGRTFKDGKNKSILLIIRYPDGSQRDERYTFNKISEMRDKMEELKEKYSGVDWSNFEYEIL